MFNSINSLNNNKWSQILKNKINEAEFENRWFTKNFILNNLKYWGKKLNKKRLFDWSKHYNIKDESKKVAIIMAGNFPLAGMHDLVCVLLSCNEAVIKPSSKDRVLITFLVNFLHEKFPLSKNFISINNDKLTNFEMVIATGSNNTHKYFEYYFKNKKSLLRKNRNSIAVLDGNETKKEISKLAEDVFLYFGLGCRNVSKIYIPKNYDFDKLFEGFKFYKHLIKHNKYFNNYNYQKTIKIMNNESFIDYEYFLLAKSKLLSPPISILYYDFYDKLSTVEKEIEKNKSLIQCVVSNLNIKNSIKFGESQKPNLDQYADNVDTLNFLLTSS